MDQRVKLAAVMEIAAESVMNGKAEDFERVMTLLPIEKADVKVGDNLLRYFLEIAMKNGRKDMIKPIFKVWERVYPKFQKPKLLIVMFTMRIFSDKLISFVLKEYNDVFYREVVTYLIGYEMSDDTVYGCRRAERIFGKQTNKEYKYLHKIARINNNYVSEYLIEKIKETSEYADEPRHMVSSYLRVYDIIPKENIPEVELPKTTEEAFNLIMSGTENIGMSEIELDDERKNFYELWPKLPRTEKMRLAKEPLIQKYRLSLSNNEEMCRIMGPSNPIYGSNGEDLKYGGERMLIGRERDYVEQGDYYVDWFTGSCDECYLKIRKRWHAVRRPMAMGGWFGCYCSWKCCKNQTARMKDGKVLLLFVDAAQLTTETFGIYERIEDEKRPNDIFKGSFKPLEVAPELF